MKYSPKQTKFIRAVLSESYQYLAYGGGIVGGKSYVTMGVLIMEPYTPPLLIRVGGE